MANFLIYVTQPAYDSDAALQVYRFATAALAQQQPVLGVFFHQAGVTHSNGFNRPLADEPDHFHYWQALQQAGIPLLVCATAASRRGIRAAEVASAEQPAVAGNLHPAFQLSGLTEFAALAATATRVVQL